MSVDCGMAGLRDGFQGKICRVTAKLKSTLCRNEIWQEMNIFMDVTLSKREQVHGGEAEAHARSYVHTNFPVILRRNEHIEKMNSK
jgi:hypothetical protein